MIVQAVDLASRFSASCLLGPGGEVLREVGSEYLPYGQYTTAEFLHDVVWHAASCSGVLVVEDVPHSMRFDTGTKAVVRLQGELIAEAKRQDQAHNILFIQPALWQRHFPGVWRQDVHAIEAVARSYGYQPPDLLATHKALYESLHGKERQDVRRGLVKQVSDYVDAFLIGVWAHETMERHGRLDVKPSHAQWYLPREAVPA